MALIRNISDTALLAAIYRARESESADPLFRDPFARRLAGERGEEIARSLVFSEKNAWAWFARTYVFDQLINQQIAAGCDLVVNLAAGLDARPYRLALPASLKWIEVDLLEITDYKEEQLNDEQPHCVLERVRLDLADVAARRALFSRVGADARQALVVSKGLIVYLTAEAAGALAEDLSQQASFRHWLLDLASPALLKMMQKKMGQPLAQASAPLKFAPPEGPDFFKAHGWQAREVRSMFHTAGSLKRLPLMLSFFYRLQKSDAFQANRPWSGACLLENVSNPNN
ncbi:MAG: class I SAM-dependent methyltransferase [Blastocatellia bacterium]|nr:class I SAM-dependent methyltransferase [Blastocatellia bacterium]